MQIQTGSFVPDDVLEPTGLGCLVIVARHHGLHITVSQLIHDNMLTGPEVSVAELIRSASGAGLNAKAVNLTWNGLIQLRKALPAIVRLEHGGCMVLLRLEGMGDTVRLVLQDPDAGDDASLLIDQGWFEKVWTGEVVLVKRNDASNTIESAPSVPSDLRPGAQKTNRGLPTSRANVHPQSRVRGSKSRFGRTSAVDEPRANLKSSAPLATRSTSALAKDTPKVTAQRIVEPLRGQIRARIGEAQTTANTVSTGSATSVATGVAGQEHTSSQARTNLVRSSSSTRQFIVLIVGAAAPVIVWAGILATQAPTLPSIANLVNSLNTSSVKRQINKTNDRVEANSDIGSKLKNTTLLSTTAKDATGSLDGQSNQHRTPAEMPPAIEPKPLETPADSLNRTEANSNLNTMANVQQLSNGDPPVQGEINKADGGKEVDSDIEHKSKNTDFVSTNGKDTTRSLDGQSNQRPASTEIPPAIESKSLQIPADPVNGAQTSNLNAMADVQQLSNGGPPIQREINETDDRMKVDSDIRPKSKNTNSPSTNGNDATRSLARQSNQRRASAEKLPAIESKSLRTSVDPVNKSEARLNLRTAADVQQVQQRLVALGYLPFLPDGVWGPHSIQALRVFRTTAGLGSDDQWDRKTEDILFAPTAPKATAPTAGPLQLPPG
jgi:Peptidase C39 family/Putative peptidoglycan binding domain